MDSPSLATMLSAQSKIAKQLQDDVMNTFDLSIGNSVVKFTNTKQATWAQARAEMRKWAPMDLNASAQKLQTWLGTPFRHGGGVGQNEGKRKRGGSGLVQKLIFNTNTHKFEKPGLISRYAARRANAKAKAAAEAQAAAQVMSLAVISYKNEDHKAMRKDYEVDLSPQGETCLVRRKTVASTPQTSED